MGIEVYFEIVSPLLSEDVLFFVGIKIESKNIIIM